MKHTVRLLFGPLKKIICHPVTHALTHTYTHPPLSLLHTHAHTHTQIKRDLNGAKRTNERPNDASKKSSIIGNNFFNDIKGAITNDVIFVAIQIICDTFWRFSDPPRMIILFFKSLIFRPSLIQIFNELERKNLLNPYLAQWQKVLIPKPIKIVFQKTKKYVDTLSTPSPKSVTYFFELPHSTSVFPNLTFYKQYDII